MNRPPDDLRDFDATDVDGWPLRQYDDVVTLRPLAPTSQGNCQKMPTEIPAGVRATVIMPLDRETGLFDLECKLGDGQFAFANEVAANLRVVQRRENKLGERLQ